ncbi:ABC transporter substrate-binding protein [Roseomonas elaeocarpi]|uniref:ABC transporter substrate-binding protein n=1 Tax=Roseomonas elaeocarpi TaxID=907779 RepID=A0ABV6K295_9PROT
MLRRDLLAGVAAIGAAVGAGRPVLAQAPAAPPAAPAATGTAPAAPAAPRVLKFIPQADLAVADPIVTTAYVSRHHGYLVWDTLYGYDEDYKPQPQMAEGHKVEEDGKRVTITLREGLKWHDNKPVTAADCVASIRRWSARDALGGALMAATEELSAPDEKTILFRLKKPFPLIFDALGKPATPVCFMMPERLAKTDPATPIKEMIGSGPFRWEAAERVPGSRIVYSRFEGYVPRKDGTTSWTAGPKVAKFDRIEWTVIPDGATASNALIGGEMDWWEQPTPDLQPALRQDRNVVVEIPDPTGLCALARFNFLHPPFNNPAIRKALLGAVSQADYMTAVIGDDRSLWRENVGFFPPDTPMASDAGMEAITSKPDYDKVKADLKAAGYKGEKITLIAASDFPSLNALAQVGADMFKKCGMEVEFISTDWGSVVQRRASREAPAKGGWSVFFTFFAGLDIFNPAVSQALRGTGDKAWFGWPTMPKLEELRNAWLDAPDLDTQKKLAAEVQKQAFEDVPYLPLGQYFQATGYRRNLSGVLKGMPLFWNVERTA